MSLSMPPSRQDHVDETAAETAKSHCEEEKNCRENLVDSSHWPNILVKEKKLILEEKRNQTIFRSCLSREKLPSSNKEQADETEEKRNITRNVIISFVEARE